MGATSVKSRILDLLSDIVVDNTAIGQFATDAAKEIINILPLEMLWSMSTTTNVTGSGGAITSARILSVSRNGYMSREIPFSDIARYESNSGSIYEATAKSPVYYKKAGKVFVLPTASSGATVEHVNYPTITFANDLSDFVGAPDEIEHLIIMKTAIKARLSELNEFQDDTEEHNLKMADLQLLQREYEGALATFIASYSRPSQQREEQ
tara:strand:- start:1207 stop:1833 length:627 start_codon:yes stop_codon:yes gene_type:complete